MRRKCNLNFSQNPSEIHSYKPPLPIQHLGFPFHISHSERWACSGCYSIYFSLCPSSALMAVYTLGNISTQMKFWKMISMQFVQVRSQNRSVPSRGGRYGKNISIFHDFITILCHVSFTILSEQYGQTNFPIIKTKPFKVTEYKKEWWIFRPKWVKIKIFVIILSLL